MTAEHEPHDGDGGAELFAAPPEALRLPFDDAQALAGIRRAVADVARASGLPADRRLDVELAVTELATNSLEHGGGRGQLRVWQTRGRLVCEVADRGELRQDTVPPVEGPLAGRGRGLLLVARAADQVIRRSDESGTVTQVVMLIESSG